MEQIWTASDIAAEVHQVEGLAVKIKVRPKIMYFTKGYSELYSTPVNISSPIRKQEIRHRIERLVRQFNTRNHPDKQNEVQVVL